MDRCSSPRPLTRNESGESVSSTRRETSVCSSFIRRARRWRLVTNLPSRPAKGLLLTENVMRTVGSEIFTNGSGSTCTGSQMVSPMFRFSKPETATISPMPTSVAFTRLRPSNVCRPDRRSGADTLSSPYVQRTAIMPSLSVPRSTRPMPMRPRYSE